MPTRDRTIVTLTASRSCSSQTQRPRSQQGFNMRIPSLSRFDSAMRQLQARSENLTKLPILPSTTGPTIPVDRAENFAPSSISGGALSKPSTSDELRGTSPNDLGNVSGRRLPRPNHGWLGDRIMEYIIGKALEPVFDTASKLLFPGPSPTPQPGGGQGASGNPGSGGSGGNSGAGGASGGGGGAQGSHG